MLFSKVIARTSPTLEFGDDPACMRCSDARPVKRVTSSTRPRSLPGAVRDTVERVDETSDHDHGRFDSDEVNDLLDGFDLVVLLVINGPLELSIVDLPLLGVVEADVIAGKQV